MNQPPKLSRVEQLDRTIEELSDKCRLDSWNSFVEELRVPEDVYPALVTARPELLRLATPRALSVYECESLYKLLAGLIETNLALRSHAEQVAHLVETWSQQFKGLQSVGMNIEHFANFRKVSADTEED